MVDTIGIEDSPRGPQLSWTQLHDDRMPCIKESPQLILMDNHTRLALIVVVFPIPGVIASGLIILADRFHIWLFIHSSRRSPSGGGRASWT